MVVGGYTIILFILIPHINHNGLKHSIFKNKLSKRRRDYFTRLNGWISLVEAHSK